MHFLSNAPSCYRRVDVCACVREFRTRAHVRPVLGVDLLKWVSQSVRGSVSRHRGRCSQFITKSCVSAGAVVGMRRAHSAAGLAALALLVAAAAAPGSTPAPDALSVLGAILPPFVSQRFDELVKAASATCEVLPQQLLFSRTSLEAAQTPLLKYSRGRRRAVTVAGALRPRRAGDALVLYVPGWWNTPSDPSSRAILEALLTRHAAVHMLDTRLSFCRGYVASVSNVMPLSHLLYSFIKGLHKSGYPVSSIHIIGFSLGAHVAGLTGKLVRKKLNATLGRITALDPARPCFARTEFRLDKRDAQFVQVVHSSSGVLGLEEPVGHADVYVNGVSSKQPECRDRSISLECDHAQAWKLYSASVTDEASLTGRRCASWDELMQGRCSGEEAVLGYSCSDTQHGMFLYKSKDTLDAKPREVQAFNPFNILRWPFNTWRSNNNEKL
nr:phospholipase A1 [Helicoverpa armigera]